MVDDLSQVGGASLVLGSDNSQVVDDWLDFLEGQNKRANRNVTLVRFFFVLALYVCVFVCLTALFVILLVLRSCCNLYSCFEIH